MNYTVSRLVAIGADINAPDDDGNTIFHLNNIGDNTRGYNKHTRGIGGRVDILYNEPDTPLHLVARHDYACSHMVELCADPLAKRIVNQKNKEGHTPWQIYFATTFICSHYRTTEDISRGDGCGHPAINNFFSAGADPAVPLPSHETW